LRLFAGVHQAVGYPRPIVAWAKRVDGHGDLR